MQESKYNINFFFLMLPFLLIPGGIYLLVTGDNTPVEVLFCINLICGGAFPVVVDFEAEGEERRPEYYKCILAEYAYGIPALASDCPVHVCPPQKMGGAD